MNEDIFPVCGTKYLAEIYGMNVQAMATTIKKHLGHDPEYAYKTEGGRWLITNRGLRYLADKTNLPQNIRDNIEERIKQAEKT